MKYYISKKRFSESKNEIHNQACLFLPPPEKREYIGEFISCEEAIIEAEKSHKNVDGCYWCSIECNKG